MDNNKTIIYCYGFASKYHWLLSLKHSFLNSDFVNFFAHTCACLSVYFQLFVSECPIVRPCVSSFFCFLSATSFFSPGFHFLVSSLVCPSSFYLFVCSSFRQFVCSYICFLFFLIICLFFHQSSRSFVRMFVHWLCSCLRPCVRSLTLFVRTSVLRSLTLCEHPFVHLSGRAFVRFFVCVLVRVFVCLFIRPFVHSFRSMFIFISSDVRLCVVFWLSFSFIVRSFVLFCIVFSLVRSPSICPPVRPSVCLFFVRACVRSFVPSLVHPLVHPLVRPPVRQLVRLLAV